MCFTETNLLGGMQDTAKKADEDIDTNMAQMVCSLTNREECLACGS